MKRHDLSINLATLNPSRAFDEAIDSCSRHGIRKVGALRDQIKRAGGVTRAARMLRDREIQVTSLVRTGLFPSDSAAERQAAIDDARQAIREAAELEAGCLIILAGGLARGSVDLVAARQMVMDGLSAVLPMAMDYGVPLALEPLHPMYAADRACVNTLKQALDIGEALGEGIGIVVDTYHTWWDPELDIQLRRAGAQGRLLSFHLADWLVPMRDLLLDRGMIGHGSIDLVHFSSVMSNAGCSGAVEVEIFSAADWWIREPDDVLVHTLRAFEALLKSMDQLRPDYTIL